MGELHVPERQPPLDTELDGWCPLLMAFEGGGDLLPGCRNTSLPPVVRGGDAQA